MWIEQDGCECDGFAQVDKGLDGQVVVGVVSLAIVSILIYDGCELFAYV